MRKKGTCLYRMLSLIALALLLPAFVGCSSSDDPLWYKDFDGDGFSDGTTLEAVEQPDGYFLSSSLSGLFGDCNDDDPSVFPEAEEICGDGIDQDCDGETDEGCSPDVQTWYKDSDGDGYSDGSSVEAANRPEGFLLASELAAMAGDCDDGNAAIFPGATEICGDGIDQNCNGEVDEGCGSISQLWYKDADSDGYSDGETVEAVQQPSGFFLASSLVAIAGDCDDANANISPNTAEICGDGIDQNCDGQVDEGCSSAEISGFFIENQENQFSVFPGETYETNIEKKEFDDLSGLTFQMMNSPSGMEIDDSGAIFYQVPADAQQESLQAFSVKVTETATGAETVINGTAYIMAVEVIASGTVGPEGGIVADEWEDFVVEIPEGALTEDANVQIVKGADIDGNPAFKVLSDQNLGGEALFFFPSPSRIDFDSVDPQNRSGRNLRRENRSASSFLNYTWWHDNAYFSRKGKHRILGDTAITVENNDLTGGFQLKLTAVLYGALPKSTEDFEGREPVVFVHGYAKGDNLGGREDTWANFPDLVYELDHAGTQYLPFEFSWRTNQRFEDAASDLSRAITEIVAETGKKVHIVAHSFGGVLSRTMLQGLSSRRNSAANLVASITTIGTPHSGIADSDNANFGATVLFPDGQDSSVFNFCNQITCHQAGEYVNPSGSISHAFLGISEQQGEIARDISLTDQNPLPSIPFQVLIGLVDYDGGRRPNIGDDEADEGDGLISFEGQRFHPSLGQEAELLTNNTQYGASITETILEFDDSTRPGDPLNSSSYGYKHSAGTLPWGGSPNQPVVECTNAESCAHDSFLEVRQWLETYSSEAVNVPLFDLNFQIVDAETGMPLEGATIVPYADGMGAFFIGNNLSDENGNVTLRIAYDPQTEYTAMVGAGGYHTEVFDNGFRSGATLATTGNQFGRIEIEPDQPARGNLEGTVIDAVTGEPIDTAYFAVYDGLRLVQEGFTNFEGDYFVSDLVRGTYRFVFEKAGYRPTTTTFNVQPQTTNTGFASLRPILSEGQMSIRLSWDRDPRDLDSHLAKYDSSGEREYHIYFADKNDSSTGDNLDLDDVSSYGPETTTIQVVDPASRYVFAVYDYAGSGSITGTSNAEVTVDYEGLEQPLTFSAPTSGEGRWWKVFEINNGIVEPCRSSCIYSDDSALRSSAPNHRNPLWLEGMKQDIVPKE